MTKIEQIEHAIHEAEWRIDNCDYNVKFMKDAKNKAGENVIKKDKGNWEQILESLKLSKTITTLDLEEQIYAIIELAKELTE